MSSFIWPPVGGPGGVTTLNSLIGAITIAAGTGINVTASGGNTLTIASTSAGDVTLTAVGTVPNSAGASLSGQVLTLQPADATHPGVLLAADWNTFNSKQAAGSYATTGLDNLTTTNINQTLKPVTDGGYSLGTAAANWSQLQVYYINATNGTRAIDLYSVDGRALVVATSRNLSWGLNSSSTAPGIQFDQATTNGFVKTSLGNGTLVIDNTTYLSGTVAVANGGTGLTSTSQNFVFAGPTSGAGAPSFRLLVAGDLPSLSGLYANTALSNLTSPTAINQHLFPNANATLNLGSVSAGWNSLYAYYLIVPGTGMQSISLVDRLARDASGAEALNWGTRTLVDTTGLDATGTVFSWSSGARFTQLTTNGFLKTSGGTGLVSVDTTTYLSGIVAIASGGTGQTTANAGFNALSPMTTLGDMIYENATPAAARLAGNITATKNFLVQTGTGTVSAAPVWGTIAAGDVPTLNQSTTGTAANVTGVVAIVNGGTGQTSKTAAFDALSPMTTGGDLIYGGVGGTGTRLPNGTVGQVLTSSGGTAAPTWSTLANVTGAAIRYYASTSTLSGTLSTIVYTTKDYDTGGTSYTAGVFTAPVSGKYSIAAGLLVTGTVALNNTLVLEIQKNGLVVSRYTEYFPATLTDGKAIIADHIQLTAGDTIQIQASTTVATPSVVASNFDNYVSIALIASSPTGTLAVATIQDQKPGGTFGGTFPSGAWQTRTLNTLNDPHSIVTSLVANQFILPAGTYLVEAAAPARTVSKHRAKLRNITDSTDTVLGQTSAAPVGTTVMTSSLVKGVFTIVAPKTFEIQHFCSSNETTDGFGDISPDGSTEIYTSVTLSKIG